MSQAGILSLTATPLPPTVPTSFVTDNGTAVPAANVLNVLGIDSTANDADGITTTGSGNTLNVVLTNRLQGTGSTVGATTTDIITFPAGATPGTYKIKLDVGLFNPSTPAGAGYAIEATVRTTGVATTIIETPYEDVDEEAALAGCDIDIVASGNNIIVRGTGTAGLTVDFSAVGNYVFAS